MNNTPEHTPKPVLPPPDRPPAATERPPTPPAAEQPSPAAAGHRPRFVIPPRPPATQSQAARPRRHFPKWRYALWAFELVILLACLEHFLFKPRRASRQAAAALAAEAAARPAASPEVIRPLADRARALPGLNEVFPAFLAPLDGLAPGSAGMRDTQLLVSEQEGLPVEVRNSTGMLFRLVPAGTATIGSPLAEAGRGDIEVPHTVDFPNHFYLGKYEVTQAQWRDIMGADNNPSGFRGDDRPVEEVSWYDCQRFTHLLCQRENVPVGTYRLPTEAEWEYACRAGTTTAYCFGDHPDALKHWADFADNNYRRTSPVGRRRANALGLYDMHGNVWEWCLDEYANYPGDDTPAAEYHLYRNLRGGNWYVEAAECRSANRARLPAASTGNMLGFRVLRMIADPPAIRKTWTPPRSIDLAPETPAAP